MVIIQLRKAHTVVAFSYYSERIGWLDYNNIQYLKRYRIGSKAMWPDAIELSEEDALVFKLKFPE